MSKIVSTDLRSRRTRKWLQQALLSLMKEKSFRAIQITEIADRAEVSRPAFYLHFHSKEELLFSHVDSVFEEFHTAFSDELGAGNINLQKICILVFQYWEKHADILQMVIEAETQQILLQRLREHTSVMLTELVGSGRKRDQQRLEFIVDYVTGGIYMLLTEWITRGRPASVEQMGNLLFDLVAPSENLIESL